MPDVTLMTATELAARYRDGSLSPTEVAETCLEVVTGPLVALNAVASLDRDMTMAQAEASAARFRKGEPMGPLDGVPISFKDSFHVAGLPRWHGTACHPGAVSKVNALPVVNAGRAGMVTTCKTTMPDFALIMSGLSSQHGIIRNAWDPETSPAGSSAGAGASVVLAAASIAVGTDMVGSVRLPAAVSGLASIKPTQGRIAYDPPGNYRSAGPMAWSVDDVELSLAALGHFDHGDFFSCEGAYRPGTARFADLSGKRAAIWREAAWGDRVDPETAAALESAVRMLAAMGAEIVEIGDIPARPEDYDAIYWNMVYKAAPDYYALPETERVKIEPVVGEMLAGMLDQTALFATQVAKRITGTAANIALALDPYDYVLSPALPSHRFPVEKTCEFPENGLMGHMAFACWFNQTGWPSVTVPVLQPAGGGVPVSVQISGKRFDDAGCLQVARLLEAARGFTPVPPRSVAVPA